MSKKLLYSWENLEKDAKYLAQQIKDSEYDFDKFITIARGGLFITGMLAQYFEAKPIEAVSIRSYAGQRQGKLVFLQGKGSVVPSNERVLICDDIIDTGVTIREVKKIFPNSRVVVLHFKSKKQSKIKPDYYMYDTEDWVCYPWEVSK